MTTPLQWRVVYTIRSLVADRDFGADFVWKAAVRLFADDEAGAGNAAAKWATLNDYHYDERIDPIFEVHSIEFVDDEPPDWTPEDRVASAREGWDIWDCGGSSNGPVQIQAFAEPQDDEPDLGEDNVAWEIVWRKAHEGSPLHVKALAYVKEYNPMEFEFIEKWMREHAGV